MVKTRALKNPISVEGYWLLNEEETETFIKVNPSLNSSEKNSNNSRKNEVNSGKNDVKEKEKKKDIYTAAPGNPFQNPDLEKAFQFYVTCRAQNGQNTNKEQIDALREELSELGVDDAERIAIARKAAISGWKSFYPVKGKSRQGKKKNGFNNFEGRNYSEEEMSELERKLNEL